MLVFGHAGIALGAAVCLTAAISRSYSFGTKEYIAQNGTTQRSSELAPAAHSYSGSKATSLTLLGNATDLRFLLIGSLLSDIVDKPIGQYFLADTFQTGRIFCHTLLFLALLTLAALYVYRSRRNVRFLALSFGTSMHLILDQMWLAPRTLLWPVYGLAFEPEDLTDWAPSILRAFFTDPSVYLPELLGAAILIWFFSVLARERKVYTFVKNGRVS